MSLVIRTFQNNPRMARRLWRFDCDLYRSSRHWIPPFRKNYLRNFSQGHRDAHGDRRHFVAQCDGDVVGHVTAFLHRELREQDDPVGTLGNFECVEEHDVARELFSEAIEWLRAEHGIRRVWAPFNCDIWHGYRLMTRGFDLAPFLGEPHNPRYYPAMFESCGFTVRKRWHSVELTDRQAMVKLRDDCRSRHVEATADGYRFRAITPRDSKQMNVLYQLVANSFQDFLGYTRPSPGVFQELVATVLRMTDPRLSCLVHDSNDAACGFCVVYPDQSAAVRAMRGRMGLRSRLRFLRNRHRHGGRVILYLLGISPAEFAKRRGLGRAVFCETLNRFLQSDYSRLLVAIMSEDSPARSLVGSSVKSACREYALYEMLGR